MEMLVEIEEVVEAPGRDRSTAHVEHRLDALDDLAVLAARGEPCIMSLEQGPRLEWLRAFLHRGVSTRRAAPHSDFDQAFGKQVHGWPRALRHKDKRQGGVPMSRSPGFNRQDRMA